MPEAMYIPQQHWMRVERAEDESLFRDLLRKARGDEALARRWLRDICGTDRAAPADTIPVPRAHPAAPRAPGCMPGSYMIGLTTASACHAEPCV